jgi:hypothetical protein
MSDKYVPLAERPIAVLRAQAATYRRMAATARMVGTQESLLKLADRIDDFADQREREAGEGARLETTPAVSARAKADLLQQPDKTGREAP